MDEKTSQKYIGKLITELKLIKASDRTITIYTYFLKKFFADLDKSPESADQDDVKKFLAKVIDNYKTKSYTLVLSSLRFFFKIVIKNPVTMDGIKTPRPEKVIKEVLTKEEVERLINAAPTQKSKLIIGFLYSTGIRISELTNLRKTDLDIENSQGIVKRGKGKKDRLLFFSKSLIGPMNEYLAAIEGEFVFPGWAGKSMSPRNVQNLLKRLKIKTGIAKKVSPHTLRRSFATHQHEAGVDIERIKEFLGHEKIDTTDGYITVNVKSLKEIKNPLDSLNIKKWEA